MRRPKTHALPMNSVRIFMGGLLPLIVAYVLDVVRSPRDTCDANDFRLCGGVRLCRAPPAYRSTDRRAERVGAGRSGGRTATKKSEWPTVLAMSDRDATDPLQLPEDEQVVYELGEWSLDLQAE